MQDYVKPVSAIVCINTQTCILDDTSVTVVTSSRAISIYLLPTNVNACSVAQ
jgi:hypothetical protein